MAKKRPSPERPSKQVESTISQPAVLADAALSFLRDTKGAVTWSARDLADTLKVGRNDAEQVAALLEAQGYAKRSGTEWVTTQAGESVSGAKAPRFTQASVKKAVEALKERIKQVSSDKNSDFKIIEAVAFGDFLLDRARVQAADVGIGLLQRGEASDIRSASQAKAERAFLRQLRSRSAALNVKPYAQWMGNRSHVDLL